MPRDIITNSSPLAYHRHLLTKAFKIRTEINTAFFWCANYQAMTTIGYHNQWWQLDKSPQHQSAKCWCMKCLCLSYSSTKSMKGKDSFY